MSSNRTVTIENSTIDQLYADPNARREFPALNRLAAPRSRGGCCGGQDNSGYAEVKKLLHHMSGDQHRKLKSRLSADKLRFIYRYGKSYTDATV